MRPRHELLILLLSSGCSGTWRAVGKASLSVPDPCVVALLGHSPDAAYPARAAELGFG